MTSDQQTALESLIGRALTPAEIAAIEPHLPDRNDVAIAALLSEGRMTPVSSPIGIGTVLAVMAPLGGLFLSSLRDIGTLRPQTVDTANVEWTLELIKAGKFDVGLPVTRAQLQAFADKTPAMADAIGKLLAVAEAPTPIDFNAVSDALNVAEGRMTLWS
jgi:hypothetical protein